MVLSYTLEIDSIHETIVYKNHFHVYRTPFVTSRQMVEGLRTDIKSSVLGFVLTTSSRC